VVDRYLSQSDDSIFFELGLDELRRALVLLALAMANLPSVVVAVTVFVVLVSGVR